MRRRVAVVALALSLLGSAGAGVALAVTPDVGDASARVAALVAQHDSTPAGTPVDPAEDSAAVVPARFAAALVASEDARFYSHHGVDSIGILRAAATALGGGGADPGGSTLDQQLATELYSDGQRGGPSRGVEQLTLGVKLDARYSKQQILAMYASTVYFGHGFYGLDAASRGYFGIAPDGLGWGQAALLAGLVQAPSADDPYRHPDIALARQRHVLARLVDTGALSAAQADAAATPLPLQP
ncbi:biosynthetic peptidoglycan transglycosylase [uncultured Pseudonocardia sp.]|uniref:biosynthetic peptidoglycan transglycosylase n=1 Tax=uncultured Pseudonocardia sp. TaxID=211455 RepID=UPI00262E44A3|nr:biosynthetic peptidoglycan transglycosylase [uncultured Pseudonocardia sp.]